MQHGKYDDALIGCPEIGRVRESVKQCSSDIAGHCGELEWPLTDAYKRPIDITKKPIGEPGLLLVVPTRGVFEIGLGERPNDVTGGAFDSVTSIGLLAEAFLNSFPAVTSIWVGFEVLQAVVDDLAVPIGNRNRLRARGDSVPERLQIVDFLFDREVVESRRWKWNGVGHIDVRTAVISIASLPT